MKFCSKCKRALAACTCAVAAVVSPVAVGHADASNPAPIAAFYSSHQPATIGLERLPDDPHEPFSPLNDPFVPYVTTGTTSVNFPGVLPDLYGS